MVDIVRALFGQNEQKAPARKAKKAKKAKKKKEQKTQDKPRRRMPEIPPTIKHSSEEE